MYNKVLKYIEKDIQQDLHEKTYIPDKESTVYSLLDVLALVQKYPYFSRWSPEEKLLAAHTVWSTINWKSPQEIIEYHINHQGETWLEYERSILELILYG